ncbi:hypothetical protein L1D16_16315 [Vibrio sp. Isolate31]|uniref:hypothetical protein n=1 Tax=Vibrio TaxID=662 RepID=UPI00069BD58C|nr:MULTISPECIES: hypothetical protein [Vibrio]MCG9554408.1 hypothetical protein [Vibrio sp. Isolate32]MCG9602367.1 hypothetical protein [Vibrio sp. Isolate31]
MRIIFWIIPLIMGVYFFNDTVTSFKYELFKGVASNLLSLSSIIFAIIGAWVAIIYPKTISRVFSGNAASETAVQEAEEDARYLSQLVWVILVSAGILLTILMIQILVPIYMSLPQLYQYADVLKSIGFPILGFLVILQVSVFYHVLSLNYKLLKDVRRNINRGRTDRNHR